MTNRKQLQDLVEINDYKRACELMLGENCEAVKVTPSRKRDALDVKMEFKIGGGSPAVNEYRINVGYNGKNLPNHVVEKVDGGSFDYFQYLSVLKFGLFDSVTEAMESPYEEAIANRNILDLYLCKALRERSMREKDISMLSEIRGLERRASTMLDGKKDSLNKSERVLNETLDLGK